MIKICGKCKTEQNMKKIPFGKKPNEYSLHCPKCNDLINKDVCQNPEYEWTDYCCEGCRIYKMLKKRKADGKMLCKKCSKNTSLTMAINNSHNTVKEKKHE